MLQPIGICGELWLGGIQVARGYLERPEHTAERFIANPWPEQGDCGHNLVYRSGDSARWYQSGELEFAGRIDFQVKLRGYRIELAEIEHALRSQPIVIDAVVLMRNDVGFEAALVAYILPIEAASDEAWKNI